MFGGELQSPASTADLVLWFVPQGGVGGRIAHPEDRKAHIHNINLLLAEGSRQGLRQLDGDPAVVLRRRQVVHRN